MPEYSQADKPFDLAELLRVFKAGHGKAEARMSEFLREDKYLLPDMKDDNPETYNNVGVGGDKAFSTQNALISLIRTPNSHSSTV